MSGLAAGTGDRGVADRRLLPRVRVADGGLAARGPTPVFGLYVAPRLPLA
jgi:hypothetical protein